jgi:hypothetical protein
VPPRTLATLANSIVGNGGGGGPPSPTANDLLGELGGFMDGTSPLGNGSRVENLNWSDLEDFDSSGPGNSSDDKKLLNGNGNHGVSNGAPPVKR